MTEQQNEVVKATADAQAARDRLSRDVAALQDRLDPKLLAQEAKDRLTDTGVSVAETAKRNPAPFAGGAALLALLLIRKPVGRVLRRRRNRKARRAALAAEQTATRSNQSGEGFA